ncbi:MAG: hypothetical protein NDI61_02305 [Bdellovibrionaceae bacterium]|nr:hypothetical protein [Pseudobdellovibrionaceae bacterium]
MEILQDLHSHLSSASWRMPFHARISTRLSSSEVWRQLEIALRDSRSSDLWPNRLSEIRSDAVEPHAVLEVKYKTPAGVRIVYDKIVDYEKGRRLTYAPLKGHVFTAGAVTITLTATKEGGCIIDWTGEYRFEASQIWAALAFRLYYKPAFFAQFEKKLRLLEARVSNPPSKT